MEFSNQVLKEVVHNQRSEFKESGNCDECDRKRTPIKLMYGAESTSDGDSKRVNEMWLCFNCYKEKMKIFQNTDNELYKQFRPEFVYNATTKEYIDTDKILKMVSWDLGHHQGYSQKSVLHLTKFMDKSKTMCGRRVPLFSRIRDWDGNKEVLCQHCRKKVEANE